ncbi:MAG: NCS1 family nucleobase:cation symporter-1 [Gemmatimonadetes bacterium]|nr:NCS1 family nucleobase:cation symporter-1 [Gemmatimonadota bacterium]
MEAAVMQDPRLYNADLAPTKPEQRTWTTWNFAALWIGMAICIPTYTLASSLVDRGWTWQAAMASVVLGNLVVLLPMVLNAHAGTRYGISFPVLVRSSFGVRGAHVPALLRAGVACGWFGIQTWIGGFAIYALLVAIWPGFGRLPNLLPAWLGIDSAQFLCFLFFWALNLAFVLRGIHSIKVLESWAAPFLLLTGVALFAWAWSEAGGLGAMLASPGSGSGSGSGSAGFGLGSVLGAGLTSAVAFWGTLALNIPDFSRYARSQRDQLIGQAVGLPPTMAFFSFIGAAVTAATVVIFGERIADPITLLARVGGPVVVVISMVGLAAATLTTNIAANVVAPATGFSNVAPAKISFRTGAIITAIIGILIMPWKLYNDAAAYIFTWLIGYGALLGPIAGIMIVDYFLLRRQRLEVDELFRRGGRYEYRNGVNWVALAALGIGVAPNLPGFLGALGVLEAAGIFKALYDWAWFVGVLLAGGIYLLGMAILQPAARAADAAPVLAASAAGAPAAGAD